MSEQQALRLIGWSLLLLLPDNVAAEALKLIVCAVVFVFGVVIAHHAR